MTSQARYQVTCRKYRTATPDAQKKQNDLRAGRVWNKGNVFV